jgi:hypothetical protein
MPMHMQLCTVVYRDFSYFNSLKISGRIMWNVIKSNSLEGVDWIDLAQDRDKWRFFANSGAPRIFSGRGCSTNSVEDRGQRERESGGGSPLVRGSIQFANEWNPYSDSVVTDVFSTVLGIRLSFVKASEFRGGGWTPKPPPPRYAAACEYRIECSVSLKWG